MHQGRLPTRADSVEQTIEVGDGTGGCVTHWAKDGVGRQPQVGKVMVGFGVAGLLLAAAPALAQVASQRVQPQAPTPGTRFEPPPGAVVDDPNRVFGDEGPDFAPLAIVGALGITPYAALAAQYDTNVARIDGDEPLPTRFQSKDDWILRPTIGARLERPVGRQRLFANASVGRIIYSRNTQLNSNRFTVGGGLGFNLGRACGGQLTAGFNTRDQLIGGFEDAGNVRSEATTYSGSLSCTTATGISAGGGYSRGSRSNRSSDPSIDRSFADNRFQAVNGNIGYRLGRRGQVGATVAWVETLFPNQLVLGEENSNTIKSYGLFASYRIGNSFNANGSVGKSDVQSNVPGGAGFTGGTWNVGVNYAGPRLGGNLAAGRAVNGGGNQPANFSVNQFFNGTLTYRVNDAMRFSAGASRSNQDFRGNVLEPQTRQLQRIKTDRFLLGADYDLARLLTFSLDLNHQRRLSVPEDFGFTATGVTFTVRAQF